MQSYGCEVYMSSLKFPVKFNIARFAIFLISRCAVLTYFPQKNVAFLYHNKQRLQLFCILLANCCLSIASLGSFCLDCQGYFQNCDFLHMQQSHLQANVSKLTI